MTPVLSIPDIFLATLAGARQAAMASLAYAAAFIVAFAAMVWGAEALPESTAGSLGFLILVTAAMAAYCLFSAAIYRRLVPHTGSLATATWKLVLAWVLIFVIAAILATAIVLFFSLIGSSLGVVSGEAGQDITDMTAQMRENGTFYPLSVLFMLTLLGVFWFAVRMMLFGVATAARGAVHVFRTWAWTKGYALPMAAGAPVFVVVPVIVFGYAADGLTRALPLAENIALQAGLVAMFQVPAAWLGHAYAAAIYTRIAPPDPASA